MSNGDAAGDSATDQSDEPPALSYEQARDELVSVVSKLEDGGHSLEESLALWERGEQLAAICQRWLDDARKRLDDVLAERATHDDETGTSTG